MIPSSPVDRSSTEPGAAGRHAAAEAMVGDSWLIRRVERCFNVIVAAWRTSAIWTWLVGRVQDRGGGRPERVRLIGYFVLSAAGVRILLVGVEYLVRPPMVGLGWVVAVPLGIVCILWPQAVDTALKSSRVLRKRRGGGS